MQNPRSNVAMHIPKDSEKEDRFSRSTFSSGVGPTRSTTMGGCVSRESEEEKDMNAVIGVKADLDKTKVRTPRATHPANLPAHPREREERENREEDPSATHGCAHCVSSLPSSINTRARAHCVSTNLAQIKLLLLGAGESGKSTIFKQMKIVYGKPSVVHQGELTLLRSVIHNNAISTMQTILEYCEMFELKGLCAPEVLRAFEQVSSADENDEIDPKLGRAIALLWADGGVRRRAAICTCVDFCQGGCRLVTRLCDDRECAAEKPRFPCESLEGSIVAKSGTGNETEIRVRSDMQIAACRRGQADRGVQATWERRVWTRPVTLDRKLDRIWGPGTAHCFFNGSRDTRFAEEEPARLEQLETCGVRVLFLLSSETPKNALYEEEEEEEERDET